MSLTDISTYVVNDEGLPDLDPLFAVVTDEHQVKAEHVARRLETDLATLEDDPEYGYNLARRLSQRADDAFTFQVTSKVAAQAKLEEGVLSAAVTADTSTPGVVGLGVSMRDRSGPLSFDLTIDKVTAAVFLGRVE